MRSYDDILQDLFIQRLPFVMLSLNASLLLNVLDDWEIGRSHRKLHVQASRACILETRNMDSIIC